MCGISGAFALEGPLSEDARASVRLMNGALAHRGPDDWGHYLDERRQVMLLHSRLSIVDLEAGHQPLSNEDGSVWVACNGEIYDFDVTFMCQGDEWKVTYAKWRGSGAR